MLKMKKYLTSKPDLNQLIDVLDEMNIWSAPFGLRLLDCVSYKPNMKVLDIGFGTGFPLTELALRLGESSLVYGIDPWKETFERVNKKIALYGLTNIKIIEGVAEAIPLDNNSIDLITSNNGINNVADMDKTFSECSRIMKAGGQFVFTMNLDKSMFEFYTQLEHVLSELKMTVEIDLMHRHIAQKRPSLDKVISLLQKNGFVIQDLEHHQFNYKFTDGTAMLNHYFIRLAFMEAWIEILPVDKVEQIFDTIESRLNAQSEFLNGLKLSIPFALIHAKKE
jgi:arsenite methyltransferase